jgi:predicted O-linked N-acetylglucosamine transferase (SPINDLY family)
MPNPQHELQRARAALGGGDAKAAARICQKLVTDNPRDTDARYLHGRCLAGLGRWRDAASEFRRVLAVHSGFFPAMVDLGIAETLDGNYRDARPLLERARAMDPRPAELHFGLGLCCLGFGDNLGAAHAFRNAIERNPEFPDAFNNLGVAYDRLGQLAEAREAFRQALRLHPDHADAHRNLGDVSSRLGDAAPAAAAFRRAAELRPADASAQAELGAALLIAGEFAEAAESLQRALELDSRLAGAAANLGEALRNLNRADRSASAFQHALTLDPRTAEAHLGLGKLASALGNAHTAARHLIAAAEIDPAGAKIALAAAAELENLGLPAEALSVLQTASGGQPGNADIHDALGAVLHRAGRLPEALDCYERALDIDERRVQTLLSCGHALESMGALSRAIACFERARTLRPSDAQSPASIASCAYRLCDWDLIHDMLSTLRGMPNGIDELQAFLLLAADLDPAAQAQSLRRRARTKTWPTRPASPPPIGAAGDRLRVAYVSPDFRIHPVAYAIAGVIENHDRSRIAPIGISLSAGDGSAIGSRLRNAFEEFIDVSALSDRDVVVLMRERRIDVAVDLAGLTTGARTSIFAMRAAPSQINFLGFPGSTGMDFMDFVIADPAVLPDPDEAYFSEKVLRMPHCYLPFDDSRKIDGGGSRDAAGLPSTGFVFCAFTNGYKITREVFQIWMSLLSDVPDSVLWLRSMGPATAANLKISAGKFGVSADRLVFAPFEEQMDAHLTRLQLADLFLDTLPYNGHTTAAEALWAGVPVVSCRGNSFAGRVGASLLSACGLSELICDNLEDYRKLALNIARSPALHAGFRDRVRLAKSAPLFDTRRYTRDLEDLLYSVNRERALGKHGD